MNKLNERKIEWIIREKTNGEITTKNIAKIQKISESRVYQIWRQFKKTGNIPLLRKTGRKKKEIPKHEVDLILKAHEKYKAGAVVLEHTLKKTDGLNIPHNRIHRVLKENNRANNEPKKQQRRKWIRYERKHSMSLWHTDWKLLNDQNKWIITYLDDASRMVLSYGIFDHATTENAINVYIQASNIYGDPRELLTDRGSQFYANEGEKKDKGISEFEKFLLDRKVKHIVGRVNHPQTNGKIERLYGTLEQKLRYFKDINEFITWYNEVRPHMSLDWDMLETPKQAFYRKLYPDQLLGYVNKWMWD